MLLVREGEGVLLGIIFFMFFVLNLVKLGDDGVVFVV